MFHTIAKLAPVFYSVTVVAAIFAAGTPSTAYAAPVKRHIAHPVKKAPVAADAPKPEKLVRAPGGVMVPKQAPAGRNPGFMDDGASKRGEKP
ncbi:hypothetical protein BH11PSE13_BH11PSE13_02760 [soil metagenome]